MEGKKRSFKWEEKKCRNKKPRKRSLRGFWL